MYRAGAWCLRNRTKVDCKQKIACDTCNSLKPDFTRSILRIYAGWKFTYSLWNMISFVFFLYNNNDFINFLFHIKVQFIASFDMWKLEKLKWKYFIFLKRGKLYILNLYAPAYVCVLHLYALRCNIPNCTPDAIFMRPTSLSFRLLKNTYGERAGQK